MITNKDIRVENGFLIINGDKYPLDGQSPETIMEIVEDNSDTTPTENSTAPVTSGGVFTALACKEDALTFDTTPTAESTNPVTSDGVYTAFTSKAEKNPSVFSDYTSQGIEAASPTVTISNKSGGYKIIDGICYVNIQFALVGTFSTPGAWSLLKGFPPSAINGVPLLGTPTSNDANSAAMVGGRMNDQGYLYIINSGTITGENSTAFTFMGSYPVAQS